MSDTRPGISMRFIEKWEPQSLTMGPSAVMCMCGCGMEFSDYGEGSEDRYRAWRDTHACSLRSEQRTGDETL